MRHASFVATSPGRPWLALLLAPLAVAACGTSGSAVANGDGGVLPDATLLDGRTGADAPRDSAEASRAEAALPPDATPDVTPEAATSDGPREGATDGSHEAAAPDASAPPSGDSVLTHHKNLSRDGVYVQPTLTKAALATLHKDPTFTVTLPDANDAVYAQPLFVDGQGAGKDLVIVATEANNVYALDAASGAQVWNAALGTPVPLASMSCGNIDPYGVTGTPVIDWASRTIFVAALVLAPSGPQHQIHARSIDTGTAVAGFPIIVNLVAKSGATTFTDKAQGQRGALSVFGGTLFVPYGGLYGDCSPYHGWVLAIPLASPASVVAWATVAPAGGVWAPGGVASDGTSAFVATGNTFAGATWGGGDAVFQLAPGAGFGTPASSFAPANWKALDNSDLDLGTAPVLFDQAGSTPSTLLVVLGKDGNGYLLDRTHLPGVGSALSPVAGQSYTLRMTSNEMISAPVVYSTAAATYAVVKGNGASCTSGSGTLTAVKVVPGAPPTLAPSWCAGNGSGAPMVTTTDGHANAVVWEMGAEGDSVLEAFDGDTGVAIPFTGHATSIPNMRRYNTPIAAKGRIFVPADRTVVAFTL